MDADSSEPNPTVPCVMCTESGTMTCTGCRAIRYCSVVCQKQDWRLHKLLRKSWDEHREPPVPGLLRGIYFSCNASAPQFVWYDAELNDLNIASFKYTTITEDIGGMRTAVKFCCNPIVSFTRPLFNNTDNNKNIHLDMDWVGELGNSMQVGPPNKAFTKIDKELVEHQKGRIFAYGIDVAIKKFFSLDMANLRHIVDLLRRDYDFVMRLKEQDRSGGAIKGVLAMCVGESAVYVQDGTHFEEVKIAMPSKDKGEWNCLPATKIGLPLVIHKAASGISSRGRTFKGEHADSNQAHLVLTAGNLHPKKGFRTKSWEQLLDHGSFYVVRQDKKPLDKLCLRAMVNYFTLAQKKHVQECEDNGAEMTMGSYLTTLSREGFMEVYTKYAREEKELYGVDYPYTSPYDL